MSPRERLWDEKKERDDTGEHSVCGQCMEPIPLGEVTNAFWAGYEYRHRCGRVIVKGRENAEVPTSDTYDSNASDNTFDITSPSDSTGNA